MQAYNLIKTQLINKPKTWLITGVAGFIGSNLLETLLKLDQNIIGLDNFVTGNMKNLSEVQGLVTKKQWSNFTFIKGDIGSLRSCDLACQNVDYVLHQAAIGSVPRSIKDPIKTNKSNITGFLNMLVAAKNAGVKSFVYAASSSTYGDHQKLPKKEHLIGNPLSPYAVTKYVNELYADVFYRSYGFNTIGLRYFNIFGEGQTIDYAGVITKFIDRIKDGKAPIIFGDGTQIRDFIYVKDIAKMNLIAMESNTANLLVNVGTGKSISILELAKTMIKISGLKLEPIMEDPLEGDVKQSQADTKILENIFKWEAQSNLENWLKNNIF